MEEFRYDTYCGLYCGACDILSAFRKARERNTEAKWEDIPRELRKSIPTGRTDQVVCYGCKSDTVFIGCSKCFVRKCARTRMRVETCFECVRFPCMRFRAHRLVMRLMSRRLPHVRSVYANQTHIRRDGIEAWLSDQEARWKCPKCLTAFTWYSKKCVSCGTDLDFAGRFGGPIIS